jgi:hypothetical protein
MSNQTNTSTPATETRRKPVVPQDLIDAKVGSKNTVYAAIKSGEIETFRLGGKILIYPAWVSKNLGW